MNSIFQSARSLLFGNAKGQTFRIVNGVRKIKMRDFKLSAVTLLGLIGAIIGGAIGASFLELMNRLLMAPEQALSIGISASYGGIFGGVLGIGSSSVILLSSFTGPLREHEDGIALSMSRMTLLFGNMTALAVLWEGIQATSSGEGRDVLVAAAGIVFISLGASCGQLLLPRLARRH
ncbi:MAG: hypothetical protein C0469_00180 [Cyanobacteria bacterium DS2.3.42]|nr:hypothetical protein [Cyanobacteria bacterium DS2.3.42]